MDEIPNALTGSFTKHNFKLTGSYQLAKPLKLEYSLNYIVQNVEDRPQTSLNLYTVSATCSPPSWTFPI